jgi:hypothetical protein
MEESIGIIARARLAVSREEPRTVLYASPVCSMARIDYFHHAARSEIMMLKHGILFDSLPPYICFNLMDIMGSGHLQNPFYLPVLYKTSLAGFTTMAHGGMVVNYRYWMIPAVKGPKE